jgi:GH25 family lysozyme M1 (1,4-beta-N-acetylmuramidase)
MAKTLNPCVVDLFHGDEVDDFSLCCTAGIKGVIHKASQGSKGVDKSYKARRAQAAKAGLLWGAYHFADSSDVAAQVDNFLKCADPDDKTLLCLDYEPNGSKTMSLDQARNFLRLVRQKTGQRPVIYSGSLIKEQLGSAGDDFFAEHRLWLCQYGPTPKIPKAWDSYWLWQYTGDGDGLGPHEIDGISTKGIDLSVYNGKDLASEWVDYPDAVHVAQKEPAAAPVTPPAPHLPI